MKIPKVSVIMAVFNGDRYLSESIYSILNQSYADFEFIIIDDGSTDDSEKIIWAFTDERVRFYKNPRNLGLAYSLNRAIRLSRGEYLVRMDQDDISFPKRISTQARFLNTHQSVDICGGGFLAHNQKRKVVFKQLSNSEEIKATLLFHNALAHPTVALRKSSLSKFGYLYDPKVRNAEDYDLWTRCCWQLKLTNLDIPLVFYRRHPEQMVSQPSLNRWVTRSRNRMIRRFTSRPTRNQLALHGRISTGKTDVSWKEIHEAERWLVQILAANGQRRLIESAAFRTVLESQWFNICAQSVKLGLSIFWQYLNSKITRQAARNWSHIAILLFKICLAALKTL